jgi:hypothetical protein
VTVYAPRPSDPDPFTPRPLRAPEPLRLNEARVCRWCRERKTEPGKDFCSKACALAQFGTDERL